MQFSTEFKPLELNSVFDNAKARHDAGWRYVQILAVNKDDGVDLIYTFMKDGVLENDVVSDVPRDAVVKSISELYLEAFVCENEIHDLFGIKIEGIQIDFQGNFYHLSTEKPMTIISAAKLAEREKAKKIAAAKAAKATKESSEPTNESAKPADSDLEEKLAGMDPEKAAKVRAAMEAKAKRASKKEA
jgi:hypothetical protein